MKVAEQLSGLEDVATRLGVRVTFELMTGGSGGTGGLCRVRGEYRVIIDRRLRPTDRVTLLADALRRFDTGDVEMPPGVRALLSGTTRQSA